MPCEPHRTALVPIARDGLQAHPVPSARAHAGGLDARTRGVTCRATRFAAVDPHPRRRHALAPRERRGGLRARRGRGRARCPGRRAAAEAEDCLGGSNSMVHRRGRHAFAPLWPRRARATPRARPPAAPIHRRSPSRALVPLYTAPPRRRAGSRAPLTRRRASRAELNIDTDDSGKAVALSVGSGVETLSGAYRGAPPPPPPPPPAHSTTPTARPHGERRCRHPRRPHRAPHHGRRHQTHARS